VQREEIHERRLSSEFGEMLTIGIRALKVLETPATVRSCTIRDRTGRRTARESLTLSTLWG
jgi:hypothetical protein